MVELQLREEKVSGAVGRAGEDVSLSIGEDTYRLDRDHAQRLAIALSAIVCDIDIKKDFVAWKAR